MKDKSCTSQIDNTRTDLISKQPSSSNSEQSYKEVPANSNEPNNEQGSDPVLGSTNFDYRQVIDQTNTKQTLTEDLESQNPEITTDKLLDRFVTS